MLTDFLYGTGLALMSAVIAVTYMLILLREKLFRPWAMLGAKHGVILDKQGGLLRYRFWYKPLFQCEKCLAGQLGLWSYLLIWLRVKTHVWFYVAGYKVPGITFDFSVYYLYGHAYTICASIFFAVLLARIINK